MRADNTGGLSKRNQELLHDAAVKAIDLIDNPHVQEQIARAIGEVIDKLKETGRRRTERRQAKAPRNRSERTVEPRVRSSVEGFSARFGNKKLARRISNVSDNIQLLQASVVDPETAKALSETEAVVQRLQVAVAMARNLPVGKRQKAHWEIDSVLDDVERAVFKSAMN